MPTAVLRRYTPPTCTLEIAAAGSALSRWTDRTVLKNLRFYLSFDDPKLHPERQVSVSGDRNQLEGLYDVVSTYVQTLIALPPEQVQWDASAQVETALGEPQAQLVRTTPTATGMSLEPQGLLSHHLNLGSLATAESGAVVHLTTLQLFDLANALEAYNADAVSLPTARTSWAKSQWANTAAVAVLALGITGVLAKFVLDISAPTVQTAAVPRERQVNSELNSELFPTLSPPPLEASPSITLQPLPPPLPGAAKTEAGLPPVGVTEPPVNSPQPQVAAPAGSLENSGSSGNSSQLDSSSLGSSSDSQQQITLIPSDSVASLPSTASESARSAEPPRLAEAGAPSAASTVPTDQIAANRSTAFDTIPQVAEIRNYFQQTWQPPEGVPQTLEYRLLLNADGSLQRIVPLGQAAETYIDRTNMPLMGETFVSPTSDGSTPQVRLVLKSNGTVQSFLEYAN